MQKIQQSLSKKRQRFSGFNQKMDLISLNAIADGPVFKGDPAITALLRQGDEMEACVLGIVDFSNQSVVYAGPAFEKWTGIPAADIIAGGIRRIVSFVNPEQLQHLSLIQAAFAHHARSNEFDPRAIRYLDLSWSAMLPNGVLPLLSTMVILTYTSSRDLGWGVCFQVREDEHSLELLMKCKTILRSIKERHNEIYSHAPSTVPEWPSRIQTTNPILEKITPRELEVLVLIAKGNSTPDIAAQLSIAANTVESHRKKLLEKFEAKNVAELIKKASKVYWLE
jgi:DNA-binding CsgD family transcriptional regulator